MAAPDPPNNPASTSPASAVPNFAEIGLTGLKRSGGLLLEEFNPKISGHRWFKVATEMRDNEPTIASAMLAIEMLGAQAPWEVRPKKDDARPEAKRVAERIDRARHDMEGTWGDVFSEALNALAYGFMPFEPVYKICRGDSPVREFQSKYDDGFIAWRKISPRAPESLSTTPWDFRPGTNDVIAMRQQPAPDYRERVIPIDKLLIFRPRSCNDSPQGKAIFRPMYVPWFYLKRLREYEAIGAEKDMAGTPDFQIPIECFGPGATAEQLAIKAHFEKMGPRLRRGEYESIVRPTATGRDGQPTGYDFKLVQSGGRRPVDLHVIIERYEFALLNVMQAEFKKMGQNGVGSHAMHSDKTSFLGLVIGALLDAFCEMFNRHEIPRLCRYNGIPRDLYPELWHGDVEKEELDKLASGVTSLIGVGAITPDTGLETHLRDKYDLPVLTVEGAEDAPLALPVGLPQDMLDQQIPDLGPGFVPRVIEGGASADAPAAPASPVVESVQDTALNGAQVTAAKEIVEAVAAGTLPRDSGVAMLIDFFQLAPDRADRIMGSVGRGFMPKEEPKPPAFGGGGGPPAFLAKSGRGDKTQAENDAHDAVRAALASGELKQKNCEGCGDPKTEAHHADYSKPLTVKWLCNSCHKAEHAE